jgi:hypothetical protein
MTEESVLPNGQVLPQYLLGAIVIFSLLLTSLLKQDLLLRIAVYGPLLTGAFAMVLMVAIVDTRHGLSGAIESRLKSRFFRLSERNSNLFLFSILIMLSYNFFWIARLQLENNNVHWFAVSMFLSCILIGLMIGRLSLSFFDSSGFKGAKRMFEDGASMEEVLEESHHILSCLANNAHHKLTSVQKQLIHEQKNRCYEHIQGIVNEPEKFEETLSSLQGNVTNPSGFYAILVSIFNPVMEVKISRLSVQASHHEQKVLDATVYLDATSLLLHSIVDKNESNDVLIWSLVDLLSNMVDAVSSQLIDSSEGTSMIRSARLSSDGEQSIVRLFAQTLAHQTTLSWDPILITVVKKRVVQAFAQLEANEEFNLLNHEKLSAASPEELHSMLLTLVNFICTYDTNGELMSMTSFANPFFSNTTQWNVTDAHGLLSQAIPMKRYTLIQHFLFCLWVIAKNLDSKE